MNTRTQAAKILYQVIYKGHSLSSKLTEQDPLLKELCYGTLRWYFRLEAIANQLLNKPIKEKYGDISCLLLVGLYQLIYTRIPDHAAVSETVNSTRELKKEWARGLVNKTLRTFLREREKLEQKADQSLAAKYSHPQWLIEALQEAHPSNWENILQANNQRAPMYLRVNQQQITRDEYLKQLTAEGIEAVAIDGLAQCIKLKEPIHTDKLPKFQEGQVSVQDMAGQFVAPLLDLQPGLCVLDACSAPGSKTGHILEAEPALEKIVSIDIDPERLPKIKDNLSRLRLDNQALQLILADASRPQQWWDEKPFDRILVDAPCSATGVIRRHPDIKILRQADDIQQQAQFQLHLLNVLWPLLAKGGTLLYTTCSILPEENEQVMQQFCKQHKDAKVNSVNLPIGVKLSIGHQLLPEETGPDGFYFARVNKLS